MILALDTTHAFGSLALVEGDRVVEESPIEAPDGFGHVLFGEIERLLERHRISVAELEAFAAASGPGSF
ncbi:MAG: tRNA (adenosine(37)-N6)-threonylcarbamoyltransferase complex dimerization subunit type 1 TsaB, partial [Bryobacteraceae bacterium]